MTAEACGALAAEPQLTIKMGGAVVNRMGERVANVKEAYDSTAGSKKVTVAQSCDAVLVLVLSSEWDANRRAANAAMLTMPPPMGGAGGGGGG